MPAVELFGRRFELTAKAAGLPPMAPAVNPGGGWYPIVRESFPGAWQQNVIVTANSAASNPAVYACITLIASDIGKISLRLVEENDDDIWEETQSAAFSPVLREPNRYQTINKFIEQWIVSKLMWGNAYVLKERDNRGVVVALYVLNPAYVTTLITPTGDIYYQLRRDVLTGIPYGDDADVAVPAREIIHDPMVCLFHPLIGVSPIFASGLAALQGQNIQTNSTQFFGNASNPGGIIIAPGAIDQAKADEIKTKWELGFSGANAGRVALLSAGYEYKPIAVNAVDAQLIDQLKWTAETICSTFHVPPYMIGVGPPPPYANIEPLLQQYYSQCLQSLITSIELSLDKGLELPTPYGTEFDIDDLIWMDTATRTTAAKDSIGAGALSPDEARRKFFGLGPVPGGDSPYLQEQYFSLAALAARDVANPFAKPAPTPTTTPPIAAPAPDQTAELVAALHRKTLALHHAA